MKNILVKSRGDLEDKLAAYHTAYFNSAAVLYVPDNIDIEEPIEGLFFQDKASDVPFNKHVLIIIGKNSHISYLERFETIGEGDAKATANISVEVIALDGSQVKFSAIDRLGNNVTTYISRRARHGKDAVVDWAIGIMNEGNVIADFDSDLYGDGSQANLKSSCCFIWSSGSRCGYARDELRLPHSWTYFTTRCYS